MGWRRTSDTESFMEVKEAYDCLRKSASRAQYDSRLVNAAGHLHEASAYEIQPAGSMDLEQEYYKEKHRNRMLVIAAGLAFILVLANIGYVRGSFLEFRPGLGPHPRRETNPNP
ncbi:hypothetical protein OSTOST_15277, partial [Ostertagia ostertagi]